MSQVNDVLIKSNRFILKDGLESEFKTLIKNVNTKGEILKNIRNKHNLKYYRTFYMMFLFH